MSFEILRDSKFAIEEQMKTLPDVGMAEASDFAVWGASFYKLVVHDLVSSGFEQY